MAYGGIPVYIDRGPGFHFRNFLRIDDLTLDSFTGNAANIAAADTGQLTTAIPGPNQTGIPIWFGRGRGNWRPADANMIIDSFQVLLTGAPPTGFVVPATVLPTPVVVNGDLILTHQNVVNGGVQLLRVILQYVNTMVS